MYNHPWWLLASVRPFRNYKGRVDNFKVHILISIICVSTEEAIGIPSKTAAGRHD